ncbi:MAG: alpha/beta hydrolase [Actinomycetota bacterium]|nr:alpha/beta hydrolase [Actinomycetota bacterium]MDA8074352.1 alpha/beta hydrolase [Actinomycetota bacterium]
MNIAEAPEPFRFADPELADLIAQVSSRPAETDVAAMRQGATQRARARAKGPDMAAVRDILVPAAPSAPAVPARLYRPQPGPAPLVVYCHGGGWTIGDLDTHDRICRRLAHTSGAAVLSVAYRLAPEHPAPAAVDDVVHTLVWVATTPDELSPAPSAVAVAGDSAGGTLAALACLRLRDARPVALPDLCVLVYANTDLTGPGASMRKKASGWGLDVSGVEFFNRQWVPDAQRWADPALSPLRAPDLRRLPPALVVTAEHDPLRDQGEAYADRLRAAGVTVNLRREDGLVHNFLMYDQASPACARAADQLACDIRRLLDR